MTHERLVQDAIWLLERQSGVGSQSAAALLLIADGFLREVIAALDSLTPIEFAAEMNHNELIIRRMREYLKQADWENLE